jgi:hypothetical protein
MDFLPVSIKRFEVIHYFIWCGNDDDLGDHIIVDAGETLRFDSLSTLMLYATNEGIHVNEQAVVHTIDLDEIAAGTDESISFNAPGVLDAWNVLCDFNEVHSPQWDQFRTRCDECDDIHCELSKYAISIGLNDEHTSEQFKTENKRLARLMKEGIAAFDALIAEVG